MYTIHNLNIGRTKLCHPERIFYFQNEEVNIKQEQRNRTNLSKVIHKFRMTEKRIPQTIF